MALRLSSLNPDHFLTQMQQSSSVIAEAFSSSLNGVSGALTDWDALSKEFCKAISRLPDNVRDIVSFLNDRGWFVPDTVDLPTLMQMKDLYAKKDFPGCELLLNKAIKGLVSDIEATSVARFPLRAPIIRQAFKAHQQAAYELSVPVFLSQAEGMCVELLGERLFSKKWKTNIPKTKPKVDALVIDNISKALLFPLSNGIPVAAREADCSKYPMCLNRHRILHGTDVSYATESNSLKAISLLGFLVTTVESAIHEAATASAP